VEEVKINKSSRKANYEKELESGLSVLSAFHFTHKDSLFCDL
jgi:hypothetical protein